MSDPSTTTVDAYRWTGDHLDLCGNDLWALALDQRAFGPGQLIVVTARPDGAVVGLAHCHQTDPPDFALTCCLDTLDDGAATAVAYSNEPVGLAKLHCLTATFGGSGRMFQGRPQQTVP